MRKAPTIGRIIIHSGEVATSLVDTFLPGAPKSGHRRQLASEPPGTMQRGAHSCEIAGTRQRGCTSVCGFVKSGEDETYFQIEKRFE